MGAVVRGDRGWGERVLRSRGARGREDIVKDKVGLEKGEVGGGKERGGCGRKMGVM